MDQESGFINSQPSMAEFMTALPHINESFQRGSSITGGSGPTTVMPSAAAVVQHQQQQQQHPTHTSLPSCTAVTGVALSAVNVDIGPHSATGTSVGSVGSPKSVQSTEYPWMKEKKTTRKQQHQGKLKGKRQCLLLSFSRSLVVSVSSVSHCSVSLVAVAAAVSAVAFACLACGSWRLLTSLSYRRNISTSDSLKNAFANAI